MDPGVTHRPKRPLAYGLSLVCENEIDHIIKRGVSETDLVGLRSVRAENPHTSIRLANGEVVLVAIYAKAKFDNMSVEILKSWKEAYDGQSQ